MSWKDNLLEASLDGIVFDCLSTLDEVQRATAEHTYPYVDGSDIEDLGNEAQRISIEAIFFGDDYESRLQAFLAVYNKAGARVLVHPVFGTINAQPAGINIKHDADGPDTAMVSLQFIRHTPGAPFFTQTFAKQKAAELTQKIETTRTQAAQVLGKKIGRIAALKNSIARLNKLRNTMLLPLVKLRSEIRGVIQAGLDVINYPTSWATDIGALVKGIVDLRAFNAGTISADWHAVFTSLNTPILYTGQIGQPASDVGLISSHVDLQRAMGKAEAVQAALVSESETATLSPDEIEQMVNETRADIEAVILQYRDLYDLEDSRPVTEALKDTALGLQEAARDIIAARPPLIVTVVEAPCNLRLLAFKLYGDHTRSDEILRLNPTLRLPNFIDRGDRLNVYAR